MVLVVVLIAIDPVVHARMILPDKAEKVLGIQDRARVVLNITGGSRRRLVDPRHRVHVFRQHQRLRRAVDHLRQRHLNLRMAFASICPASERFLFLLLSKNMPFAACSVVSVPLRPYVPLSLNAQPALPT